MTAATAAGICECSLLMYTDDIDEILSRVFSAKTHLEKDTFVRNVDSVLVVTVTT